MSDQFKLLPAPSWRGIVFPVTQRSVTRAHDKVEHKIQYRNGFPIEMTGARNWTFEYTIPFREDISVKGYRNLFTVTMPQLIEAFEDTEVGELVDPVYGVFRCVPDTWQDTSTAAIRDGTDVVVSFVHSPQPDDAALDIQTARSAEQAAIALGRELEATDWEDNEPPPPLDVSLLAQLSGFGEQLQRPLAQTNAQLNRAAYDLENIESTAEELENPQKSGIIRSSRRLRLATFRIQQRAEDPLKSVRTLTTNAAKTTLSLANDVGMTLEAFLRINPKLAGFPIVPAGTVVRVNA
jgi:hypothetical protein